MPWKVKSMPSPHAGAQRQDRRPTASQRGYGSDWQRIRAAHLRNHPDCEACGRPGSHVDHIIPRARGGGDDAANLQTLCAGCHSRKTATRDGGFGHARG